MKLTKEQITYIDDYLKHHKVKYWDIRIELLDHIVTTVEEKMERGISFDDAMIEVHKSFGNKMTMYWNSGIEYGIFANSNGYKNLVKNKTIEINKKYRKLLHKEIFSFFKSFKNIGLLLSLFLFELFISKQIDFSVFKKLNLILFICPIILFYIYSFKNYMMKRRSINMQYSLSQVTVSFLILQGLIQFITPDGFFKVSVQTQVIILALIVPLNLAITFCGFEVYRKAEKFYSDIFNKLQKL